MFELPSAPRLSGPVLRSVLAATAAEPVRRALVALMRKELGFDAALALPAAVRGSLPLDVRPLRAGDRRERASADLPIPATSSVLPGARGWQDRYRDGASPEAVIERAFAEARRLASATPSMSCFAELAVESAMRDARASAARWAKGAPLGPLDGVPVPIKEEVDIEGFGHRLGTSYLPRTRAVDATATARLRAAGAIILGATCMTEVGLSPLGGNAMRDMPRNAHAQDRLPGGSSSGSGVAVASGLAPVALAVDGGGSIRIPAAFNGVFGIKPTFGRISRQGTGSAGSTVAHLGPIGASAYDLAVFLEAASGFDAADTLTRDTPALQPNELVEALGRGVAGLRVGVLEGELEAADPATAEVCREALRALEQEGAVLTRVALPLAPHAPAIGYPTIGLETYAALLDARRDHFGEMGLDVQLLCRLLSAMKPDDYVDMQRLRATLRLDTAALLRDVDVLALPTTARVAPPITDAEMKHGFADTPALADACRFAFLGNLTGLPCGTAPVGSGEAGLPVGLQIIGDAFDEHSVLAVLAHLERMEVARVRKPRLPVRPLG